MGLCIAIIKLILLRAVRPDPPTLKLRRTYGLACRARRSFSEDWVEG